MDAISYAHSAKQEQRIKKFINDPDSTSGVLTVPKVIASGENITIPAGRVAILPDVQVDGTLNVLGDIFIPSGTANSKVVQKVTSTDNAIVRFDGVTGDVQNSGVIIDDSNKVSASSFSLSSGLGTVLYSNNNMQFVGLNTDTIFGNTGAFNTKFYTNGAERMRIDSAGNVGIGTVPSAWLSTNKALQLGSFASVYCNGYSGATEIGSNVYQSSSSNWNYISTYSASRYEQNAGNHRWYTAPSGTAGNVIPWTQAMTLTNTGNLLVGTTTDNGVDKLQVNGSLVTTSTISYTQLKRNANSPMGMTGYFGDKIEYAFRSITGTTSKTFRVTCSVPSNNENFGVFIKTKQVQYNVNPCMGIFDWMCGFKQPGSGATVTLVHTTTCASYGMANQISINVVAVNSSSFDITLSTTAIYLSAVIELEAIYTSGTCTITPL